MNKKMKKSLAIVSLAVCGGVAFSFGVANLSVASAETAFESAQIEMIKGASVRYYPESTVAESGIRFSSAIKASDYKALEEMETEGVKVSYGMVIAPYSYFTDYGEFNAATVFGVDGEKKYTWEGETVEEGTSYTKITHVTYDTLIESVQEGYDGYYEIKGSLIKIKESNLTKEFVGRGYIKYETAEGVSYKFANFYDGAVENNVRSIVYVSQLAIDANDDASEWVYNNYVSKVTEQATTYTIATYVGEELVKTQEVETKINATVQGVNAEEYEGYSLVSAEKTGKAYANGRLTLKHVYEEIADSEYQVKNGGFETGDLTGWTLVGNIGDVSSETNYWYNDEISANGFAYGMDGTYMFSAYAVAGLEKNMGTLKSSTFTVSESGWITYKLGGAKNSPFVHVDVVEAATGKILKRYFNQNHRYEVVDGVRLGCELNAYKANLQDAVGKQVYLRVADYASGDFGLFFLDSVDTLHLAEPKGYTLATEAAHENTIYDLFNGTFEDGMNGWTKSSNIGDISENTSDWFGDFHNEGKYFSCYAPDQAEGSKGTLRSNVFEIGGTGWISFHLGAMKHADQVYMEVIDAVTGVKYGHFYNQEWKDEGDLRCGFIRYKANLSAYIGKLVYINFVDNAGSDYGLIFCDQFVTYYENTENMPTFEAVNKVENIYTVMNGGFETGNLLGWTATGGFVNANKTYWEGDGNFYDQNGATVQYFMQDDDKFYMSDDGATGVMQSSTFLLGGDGWLSFKLGAAKHDCEIQVCLAETGEVLASVSNPEFNDPLLAQIMLRRFVNLNKYVGKAVYIKVVDNAAGDFGFITFDAVKASMTDEEAAALLAADKAFYATYKQEVVDSDAAMGSRTKEIVNAVRAYYANLALPEKVTE